MRFEVQYPEGPAHEIELQGTVAILGRDPACDLVLNDPKCSRRHAVLEAGPQGISIRDTGSANGVFVNGKKVERANLQEGDLVRMGDVLLKVLSEEVPGTLVMGPDDLKMLAHDAADARAVVEPGGRLGVAKPPGSAPATPGPEAAPSPPSPSIPAAHDPSSPVSPAPPRIPGPAASTPPSAAPPPPRPVASRPGPDMPALPPAAFPALPPKAAAPPSLPRGSPPRAAVPLPQPPRMGRPSPRPGPVSVPGEGIPRPLTVTVLAILWLLSMLAYALLALRLAAFGGLLGAKSMIAAGAALLMTLLSGIMAVGLWTLTPWARILQLIAAALGLLVCPFTVASGITLAYLLRPAARIAFSGRRSSTELAPEEQRLLRAGSEPVFALGLLMSLAFGIVMLAAGYWIASSSKEKSSSSGETSAIARLRTMAVSQEAFRAGTCNAYADLDGLLRPATVIPNYPASGPPFLDPAFATAESDGYRFELQVGDPITPAEGCPLRSFRRYEYSATPRDAKSRHFLVGSDGQVRAAEGRPATARDRALAPPP